MSADALPARLEHDLAELLPRMADTLGTDISVYLVGGYARGEGAWVGGSSQPEPYNDYDFAVFCPQRPKADIRAAEREWADLIGLRWVDLHVLRSRGRRVSPSIFNYELQQTGRHLLGPDVRLRQLPLSPEALASHEVLVLFLTRAWTLLGGHLVDVGAFVRAGDDPIVFHRYQMAKAVLAAVDVHQLMRGRFLPTYEQRVESYLGGVVDPARRTLVERAFALKLAPQADLPAMAAQTLYEETHAFFRDQMRQALSWHFGRPIQSARDFERAHVRSARVLARRLGFPVVRRTSYRQRCWSDVAQAAMVLGYEGDGRYDPAAMATAQRALARATLTEAPAREPAALRERAASLRLELG